MALRGLACAFASALALLRGGGVAHAELDLSSIEDVEALSLADLLERPMVTASRYEQKPGSSPFVVSSISHEDITALGHRTIGDALRSMRGVYLSSDRNYSYLGVRGFAVPGDYNTRFALSIDGHRVNDVVYGQAAPGLELGLPLIAIDRIELLRGGAWSVYGQNALLGAIQVVTASGASRPGLEVRATANATAETYGDPAGRSSVAPRAQDVSLSYGKVARGFDLFVAASYQIDPGLEAIYLPELATDELGCVGVDALPRPCDGIIVGRDREEAGAAYIALRGKSLRLAALASRRDKLAPTAAFSTIPGDRLATADDHLWLDAQYAVRNERSDLDAHVSVDHYGYAGQYPMDVPREGYEALPESRIVNEDAAVGRWLTGELRGRYKWPRIGEHLSEVELAAGSEAQWQRGAQRNRDGRPEGAVTHIDRVDRARMVAVTGHAMARAFDRVVGFAALRGDYYPDAFGLTVNPQAGLVVDLEEQGRIRGSYARGFRAPNFYEMYYWSTTNNLAGTSVLGPERSDTREVSYERYLGGHVRVLAVAFSQRIEDLIALGTDDSGESAFSNQGAATSQGFEVELEGHWDRLRLRGAYAFQSSHDQDGEHLVNSPSSLAVGTAFVPVGARGQLAVETSYIGSRTTVGGEPIAPVFLTTASLMLRDVTKGLDLSFGVRNLFDARTADPGGEEHSVSRIPSDPRTVWLQATARLGGERGRP